MSPQQQTSGGTSSARAWKEDTVFTLFADPVREKLLLSLVRQPWRPPSELKIVGNRRLDATIKRLSSMRSEGFLVKRQDSVDYRRTIYGPSPALPLVTVEGKKMLDFGFLKAPVDARETLPTVARKDGSPWESSMVYHVLRDPIRREIIVRLAQTPALVGEELNPKADHKISTALKQLRVLCAAGWLVKTLNERDGRRPLYSLSPDLPLVRNGNGIAFEFGFCTVILA